MRYKVDPGLYAVGRPTVESPVLVSANYKLSFDRLRSQLTGLDAWMLVLDTHGVNVWCSAGKGTFGTDEIVGASGQTAWEKSSRTGRSLSHSFARPALLPIRSRIVLGSELFMALLRLRTFPLSWLMG